MPTIILDDIYGVSPLKGPVDTIVNMKSKMITEKQGEEQVDMDAGLAHHHNKLLQGLTNRQTETNTQHQVDIFEDADVIHNLPPSHASTPLDKPV